jgi:hypothetical protein
MSGRRLSAAAAMAGPVLTIRWVRSTAMNRTNTATPAVVPIVHQRMAESKPVRSDPSVPKDHCEKERNREYDLGGLPVVGSVLPVRDDAVREHDLNREHE